MSYKFAHFADVHWRGLTRHEEYKRSFEDAFVKLKEEKVDAIFIVGDIVHSKTQGISPELINSLCWWFRGLAEIAPTYVTLGNHDGLIMNKDREDAISPIIKALNIDNLHLIKNTESLSYDNKIQLSNFSPFDEENWPDLKPVENKINIALFHGAVTGSETDISWQLDGEVEESFFHGFDFVFLGDIHKHQYIDKEERIAYCGSTIQQNFGETPGKGFMIWEIDDKNKFESKHVPIKHDRPYVTIDWMGSVPETLDASEEYPDYSRFRIRTTVPINQAEIKQIYSALKEFKSASEIVMKHDVPKTDLILEETLRKQKLDLKDPSVISDMIQNYFKRANINERMNEKLSDLVYKCWKNIDKNESIAGGRWSIKSLEFDNTFGYGKDNEINFDKLGGITGIFGKNRIGKSSIPGTLMYTLFNTTDRGSISNLHVINSRKGHCKGTALVSKKGKLYKVERQTVKKESRAGKLSASTQLNLLEVDSEGNVIKDLCGEQRRETEKTLRELVGIPEDFLLTAFASQGEMNSFLKQKASSRKSILSKFLELDVFDQLHDTSKAEAAGTKQLIKNAPDRDFDVSIVEAKNKLSSKTNQRKVLSGGLDTLKERIRSLDLTLATREDSNLVTKKDVINQEEKIKLLKEDIANIEKCLIDQRSNFSQIKERTQKLQTLKNTFPIDELKESLEKEKDLDVEATKTKHSIEKEKQRLKAYEKEAKKLNDTPCNDSCPVNKYMEGALKAKKSIKSKNKTIEKLAASLKITRTELKKIQDRDLEKKLEKFNTLMDNFREMSDDKNKVQVKIVDNKNNLEKLERNLSIEIQLLDEMKVNVASEDVAQKITEMRNKLSSLKDEAASLELQHRNFSEDIGLLQAQIQSLNKEKAEYDELLEEWRVYELFMQATSKNGIPLEIIRSRLPEINLEIESILQGVTGFTVELESDEGSNDMNIYINYGDSKRIIECCSGMEKMMAAMAIRVALTNVSELSKSDIFIIDEGFGSLDSGNIEACSRFLESLKKWFHCILIISHVDAVKDSVDNVLEVNKDGNDAKVVQK